ncbi:MAG TPA: AarF/UbiB family protein [Chitinophagales bacterium]|nr:AarF/UbiB family protein [Chitinophagales bacterium]
MAITVKEVEPQILTNGNTSLLTGQPQLLGVAPAVNVAHYDPAAKIKGNGIRGWFRAARIIWTFTLYHLFVYAYHRGWFVGKKDESEEKHLQWQAEWLSRQLLKLGPTFIKIGQSVSTRADLLPLAYIKELSKLQDNVPAFPNEVAMQIIERELGKPIDVLFAEIESEPIAAASLGQVYQARLHSGETVAVKVQRPDLAKTINFDIAVLRQIAQFMMRFPQVIRGIDWEGILGEFATVIFEEMDYVQEGQNAETFRANFRKWPEVYVPTIYWSHSIIIFYGNSKGSIPLYPDRSFARSKYMLVGNDHTMTCNQHIIANRCISMAINYSICINAAPRTDPDISTIGK